MFGREFHHGLRGREDGQGVGVRHVCAHERHAGNCGIALVDDQEGRSRALKSETEPGPDEA